MSQTMNFTNESADIFFSPFFTDSLKENPTLQSTNSLDDFTFSLNNLSMPIFDDATNFVSPQLISPENKSLTPESASFDFPPTPSTSPFADFSTLSMEMMMFPNLQEPATPPVSSPSYSVTDSPVSSATSSPIIAESFSLDLYPSTNWTLDASVDGSKVLSTDALVEALKSNETESPVKQKSKVGRKRKIRPTDPEEIAREAALKRSKNTEAARKSRLRKVERMELVETELDKMSAEKDQLAKKVASLENLLGLYKDAMKENGVSIPVA